MDIPARELLGEILQAQEPHARRGTTPAQLAMDEFPGDQDGGHAGNLRAVVAVRREMPFHAQRLAILALADEPHEHAAPLAAQAIETRYQAIQGPRPALDGHRNTQPAQSADSRQHEVLDAEFQSRAELHRLHAGITDRKELQVGHVTSGCPAGTELREAESLQFLPAEGRAG